MLVSRMAVEGFAADLRSAMGLREQFFARAYDRQFVLEKGRIVYAVDASVLHHVFPQPPLKREETGEREQVHPFRIFSGLEVEPTLRDACENAESRLAAVICNFLLEGFAGGAGGGIEPLILLPGHDIESNLLYGRIAARFNELPVQMKAAEAKADYLAKLYAAVEAGDADRDLERRSVLDSLFDILYLINEPHEQFHRFNQLTREQRLLRLDTAASYRGFQAEGFRIPGGGHVFAAHEQLKRTWHPNPNAEGGLQWWEKRLKNLRKAYRENDSAALRTLDLLNKQLRNKNVRVVLFTLNDAIIEGARDYFPYRKEEGRALADMSFADLYLRHPRCLLAEPGLSSPVEIDTRKPGASMLLDAWVDTMLDDALGGWRRVNAATSVGESEQVIDLPSFRRWREHDGHDNRIFDAQKLKAALLRNNEMHTRLIEHWSDYIARLCDVHTAATPLAREGIRRALDFQEGDRVVVNAIERIRAWVWDLINKSWTDFFNTAADTGLELIKATSSDLPVVWPIPQIVIRGEGPRADAMRAMWTVADVRRRTAALMETIADLRGDTEFPNSYVHALGYGVIFASVDRWPLTRLLAQRAVQIVRSKAADVAPTPGEEAIDGREAFYLLAQASRITGDLDGAREALTEAQLSFERAPSDGLDPPLTGLRFEVESLEIEAVRLMLVMDKERAMPSKHGAGHVNTATRQLLVQLGRNAISMLAESNHCGSSAIKTQAAIALRSIYFLSIALLAEANGWTAARVVEDREFGRSEVAKHVIRQDRDIVNAYGETSWLPLRDRALLHIAASASGVMLREDIKKTYRQVCAALESPEHSISPADRKLLLRLENLVEGARGP